MKVTVFNIISGKKFLFGFFLGIASLLFLYQIYGAIMFAPNSFMLSTEGEASRVYYVFASHAKVDTSYTNFQGMNYPYGEHIVFCDAQPLLANSFRFLAQIFPPIVNYAVGIQNAISLYGLILGAIILYLFLLRNKVVEWFAALLAFSIMAISPQVLRMPWQPSLAYFFYIPLVLFLFQSYIRSVSFKSTCAIFVLGLIGYFLNPYLGIINTLFFGVIMLVLLFQKGQRRVFVVIYGIIQTLLPGTIYQLYVKITDTRIDRVDMPTGLHEFTANFSTLFTSPYTPLKSIYEAMGVDMINLLQHFEGMGYVGVGTILALAVLILMAIFNRKAIKLRFEEKLLAIVSIAFFLLAIGFPFVFHPKLEALLSLFKPLRQLRALGRMIWMVSFCLNLVAFILLFRLVLDHFKSKLIRGAGFLLLILMLGLNVWEGSYLHREANKNQLSGNLFTEEGIELTEFNYVADLIPKIDPSRYEAIVPIPFFHVGSELFVTQSHTSYKAMAEVIALAFHTNLPLTSSYLSRLSVKESKRALQFFAPEMISKEIASDFKSDKPLLLVISKTLDYSDEERRLVKLGKLIHETEEIALVELDQDDVWKTNRKKIMSWYQDFKEQYKALGNVYYFGNEAPFTDSYASFDNSFGIDGGAAFESSMGKYFFDQSKTGHQFNGKFEVSFWVESSFNRLQSLLVMEVFSESGEMIVSRQLHEAKRSFAIKENWVRWQAVVNISSNEKVRFYLEEPSNNPGVVIDNLLIAPINGSVFMDNKGKWWWNNYPLY